MNNDRKTDWHTNAACRGQVNGDHLMPDGRAHSSRKHAAAQARAIATCNGCSVRDKCLNAAIGTGVELMPDHIAGGLTPKQRVALYKPAIDINHGTIGGYRTHHRRREQPCPACLEAQRDYARSQRARGGAA